MSRLLQYLRLGWSFLQNQFTEKVKAGSRVAEQTNMEAGYSDRYIAETFLF